VAEEPIPLAEADEIVLCRACGHELEQQESYCGLCGAPRPSEEQGSGDLQSKWASLWHLKQAADIRKSEAAKESEEEEDSASPSESKKGESLALESAAVEAKPEVPTATPWSSASQTKQWLDSFSTPRRKIWLAKHRANLYLATAAALLCVVIAGWGSHSDPVIAARSGKNPAAPQLSLFEKTLIELGLAVPPPSPTYRGNPDTRVWEDERTALYYCPGADLYGKTERGKFGTQREAQQDQFEPAFRRPCE